MHLFIPPWARISASRYDFLSNSVASPSIFTGALNSVDRTGDRVKLAVRTDNASRQETEPTKRLLQMIRAGLRGQANRVWCALPGYTPAGSFPATELLSNNTFASGTTGFTAGGFALAANDRVARGTVNEIIIAGDTPLRTAANVTITQYAPYVARFFVAAANFPGQLHVALRDTSAALRASGTTGTGPGLYSVGYVHYETAIRADLRVNSSGGSLPGQYVDTVYASLSRCALVDNGPNLLLHSDDYSNAVWTKNFSTVTANAETAPDGTATADRVFETVDNDAHAVWQQLTVSAATNVDYTLAVALKPNNRTWVMLTLTHSTDARVHFDLTGSGAIGTTFAGAGWASLRASIRSLGDGWYYCTITARKTSADTTLFGNHVAADGDGTWIYAGSTTPHAFSIWRSTLAQSSVPTRLVQTTTAATSGASQTGIDLHLKGLPASMTGLLLFGDWVQIGNQLCKVTAQLDSDAAGLGSLRLAYPPRVSPADNDPVIVHEPMGKFALTSSQGGWDEWPGIFSDHDFDLIEDLVA